MNRSILRLPTNWSALRDYGVRDTRLAVHIEWYQISNNEAFPVQHSEALADSSRSPKSLVARGICPLNVSQTSIAHLLVNSRIGPCLGVRQLNALKEKWTSSKKSVICAPIHPAPNQKMKRKRKEESGFPNCGSKLIKRSE